MRTASCLLMLLVSGLGADWSQAQTWPAKPVRIQTAGAGGSNDVVARLIANELATSFGQPVVVENRPAGIILGSGVAKAAPDGYTLMVSGGTLWLTPLFEEAPYDVVRDFAPIATLARSPTLLVVTPSLPAKSVVELVKLAKARAGELNASSGPTASASHLAVELFKSVANADILRVSYKGAAQETADLMAGQVHMTFGSGATWASHIKSGKVRALATGGSGRSLLFPDLPTVAEALPGFISEALLVFMAPAKTPDAIIRRLNQETLRALEKPEVRERLLKSGQEPAGGTPEQLGDAIKSEIARVARLIKDAGIKSGG